MIPVGRPSDCWRIGQCTAQTAEANMPGDIACCYNCGQPLMPVQSTSVDAPSAQRPDRNRANGRGGKQIARTEAATHPASLGSNAIGCLSFPVAELLLVSPSPGNVVRQDSNGNRWIHNRPRLGILVVSRHPTRWHCQRLPRSNLNHVRTQTHPISIHAFNSGLYLIHTKSTTHSRVSRG